MKARKEGIALRLERCNEGQVTEGLIGHMKALRIYSKEKGKKRV